MTKTIAHELAKKQREISVSQFFEKNRHLLGFDNKRKALLTTVKEAVDNALDACEEARILPEIKVDIIDLGNNRFKVIVEDNGPGIVKQQIPKIFGKLLYGSKFFKLAQSRGQQGIGISASVLYAQLTTGKPVKIISKIGKNEKAHYYELHIDTQNNKPVIVKEELREWKKEQGSKSVDNYLKQTAIANPYATIIYTNPKSEQIIFPRVSKELPRKPKEIKPHPYGVEIGRMISMLKLTNAKTLQSFLMNEFSRVGSGTAKLICQNAALLPSLKPKEMSREQVEKLIEGIRKTKLMKPETDCLSPIGAAALEKGLKKEINAEFYCAVTRPPSVYRGNPFIVEAALAYGHGDSDSYAELIRFANRVPLLYQQSACAITKAVTQVNWRAYGLSQGQGTLPIGPLTIVVHIASVWVPYTSESKEAIAHYPEIIREIKLALQEVGRKLAVYVHKKKRIQLETKKRSYIETYIPHLTIALKELLGKKVDVEKIKQLLKEILEKKRGKIENISVKNVEYDEEFAKIGREEKNESN